MTLANLDQALRLILEEEFKKQGSPFYLDQIIMAAMRRAYRLAERKEELAEMMKGPQPN